MTEDSHSRPSSEVDDLYKRHIDLLTYLDDNNNVTFRTDVDGNFRKVLVIAAASFFEKEIAEILKNFARTSSKNDVRLVTFIETRATGRQYSALFDWDQSNASRFFRFFGNDFKTQTERDIKTNADLEKGIKDFLGLGCDRNYLVHNNFAMASENKTSEEIYKMYNSALIFIDYLKTKLVAPASEASSP